MSKPSPTATQQPVLVSARDLTRTFAEGTSTVVAVAGVTCVIRRGDRIAITGPSGSGKSTLTYLLAGLDTPTAGTVDWPAIGSSADLRPGPVGVVFQGPSLLPLLSAIENVELPLLLQRVRATDARDRAATALEHLGLSDVANQLPEELSGGQAQRVAVARVLAGKPDLILADEPTGQLDRINANLVIEAITAAADLLGAGLLVNTHDQNVADRLTAQWQMHDGHLHTGPRERTA